MKLINFHKKNTNRLKRKMNKLNKNLANNDISGNNLLYDKLYFITQNINNLINHIDMLNYELQNNENIKDERIIDLIEKDKEAQEILDKFLPLMLYYQTVKNNS